MNTAERGAVIYIVFTLTSPESKLSVPSEKITCRRQVNRRKNKVMGDRSPKSNQKKFSQKQAKASSADQKKKEAVAAKQSAGNKR